MPAGAVSLDEDQLEGWFGDGEVGVPGPDFGRFGAEQLGVELDRGVEVADVEGELDTGHGGNLRLSSTNVDALSIIDASSTCQWELLHGDDGPGKRPR